VCCAVLRNAVLCVRGIVELGTLRMGTSPPRPLNTHARTRTHTRTQRNTHKHKETHTNKHTYTYTLTHTYVRTHTHTHTHTHTSAMHSEPYTTSSKLTAVPLDRSLPTAARHALCSVTCRNTKNLVVIRIARNLVEKINDSVG
jgi:hypothetical protein